MGRCWDSTRELGMLGSVFLGKRNLTHHVRGYERVSGLFCTEYKQVDAKWDHVVYVYHSLQTYVWYGDIYLRPAVVSETQLPVTPPEGMGTC
jgi:hypothetical protein